MTPKHTFTFRLAFAALFAALVCALTFIHLPVPMSEGYVHLGDAFVFLAGCMLPTPYAMAAAALGGGLADVLSGFAAYAPATLIIKALIALCFSAGAPKLLSGRNALAFIPAAILTVGGYFLADGILAGNLAAGVPNLVGNSIQTVGSILLFVGMAAILDKAGVKNRLFHRRQPEDI
ncbi:MAG: TIGR04002 family protein [Oscillospiraceae bacterium]|jgi:uncharacterized repeat protein (TIGR04002 family)|nr:TIGR04002 family protein [Oscillospiraceae bacterium]